MRFPFEVSAEIASFYYQPFFQSLNAKWDKALDEVGFASKLYVDDTPESKDLKAAFAGFTILIERAMRGEDGLKVQRSEFNNPDSLGPLFMNFLRLASTIRMDPQVRHFTVISQVATEAEWQNEWRGGDSGPEEVEDCVAGPNSKSRSTTGHPELDLRRAADFEKRLVGRFQPQCRPQLAEEQRIMRKRIVELSTSIGFCEIE